MVQLKQLKNFYREIFEKFQGVQREKFYFFNFTTVMFSFDGYCLHDASRIVVAISCNIKIVFSFSNVFGKSIMY